MTMDRISKPASLPLAACRNKYEYAVNWISWLISDGGVDFAAVLKSQMTAPSVLSSSAVYHDNLKIHARVLAVLCATTS